MSLSTQTLLNGFVSRTNHFLHKYNIDHNYLFSQKHIVKYSELLETSVWGNWNEFMENHKPMGKTYKTYTIYKHPQKKYEIKLIEWNGHTSFINAFINRGYFIKVISGSLTSETYVLTNNGIKKIKTTTHTTPKEICYNHERLGFHKLISQDDTYSIHVYFPSI
jgi:hypothetical protein